MQVIRTSLTKSIQKLTDTIRKVYGLSHVSEKALTRIAKNVRSLSGGLTEKRELSGELYMNEEDYLEAYVHYFYPVSYAQGYYILSQIDFRHIRTALDLGSGPGPMSMLLSDFGVKLIKAVDYSPKALALAAKLMKTTSCDFRTVVSRLEDLTLSPDEMYDCIVFGHSLNELWKDDEDKVRKLSEFVVSLAKHLTLEGKIVIIEPGTNHINHIFIALRDTLCEAGLFVEYPCVCEGGCPQIHRENGACHSEYAWERPAMVKDIALRAGVKKEILNMSAFVVTKSKKEIREDIYRVISDRMLSKSGRYRYMLCGKKGIVSLSIKKDDRIPSYTQFISLKHGDLISFRNAEVRENGYGLSAESTLEVVSQIR